jgi:hypothetical protein
MNIWKGYLAEHNRRFAREAARAENYHVRARSTAKLREVFRLETERWISNDWVVQYRGHSLQLQPQNKRYGPTQAKALVCEWEDGAVEVHYTKIWWHDPKRCRSRRVSQAASQLST